MFLPTFTLALFALVCVYSRTASAATAEQWRGRSIYQVITDRYALPAGSDLTACDPGQQTWCGGTWNTIRENLDYIQDAGFTAIWISPVSQNYEGPRTAYGDAYHGYWIADVTKLNDRYGTSDDLKALSAELHKRGMYLMVDIVANNVMSTTINITDYSTYHFQQPEQYHTYCPVVFGNTTSEQDCWLGDTNVPLPDLNTEDPTVMSEYQAWIQDLVTEYSIDGLRLDAAKHTDMAFWPPFCAAAGVYCIGEVYDADVGQASAWQGPQALDAILGYPMYSALLDAFTIPGPQNISALVDCVQQSKSMFHDQGLLGNFLENQDLPRWHNLSVDPQSMYNAMTWNFMYEGIPIVYYGQEQGFSGVGDPFNREPMWTSGYANTTAYKLVQSLNQFRNFLVAQPGDWLHAPAQLLTSTNTSIAFLRGQVVTILTNIGSPPAGVGIPVFTPWNRSEITTDVISCQQYVIGSNGTVEITYGEGGKPTILVPNSLLSGSGICGASVNAASAKAGTIASSSSAASSHSSLAIVTVTLGALLSAVATTFL